MRIIAYKGYIFGIIISMAVIGFLSWSDLHYLRVSGQLNTGHEKLACQECHESADGSIRQQIQANLAYLLALKPEMSAFNFEYPNNKDCLACHEREDDRHPVYRFNEPRFLEARQAIQPQFCVSCHQEHTGLRVSSEAEICQHCHTEIEIKDDPLDIAHSDLIKLAAWDTCLSCHDFHGNHLMQTAVNTKDMLDKQLIQQYLQGGKDPYSIEKKYTARKTRYENKSN